MHLSGIPVIQPISSIDEVAGPAGSPQPILQLKELAVDQVRYQEWRAQLRRKPRSSILPVVPNVSDSK